MTSAARPVEPMEVRLRRAFYRHPVVSFFRARKLITFYSQLHALARAGVALPTAFGQLQQYAPDAAMAQGLGAVAKDVQLGDTLGDSMRKHSALFDDANVELVAFAEEAGRLEPVLASLVSHLEQVHKQRWRAVLGAIWPLYLGGAAVFVGPLLSIATTPGATQHLGASYLSGLLVSLFSAFVIVGGVLGLPFALAAANLEVEWDRLKRNIPILTAPMRTLAASRFVLGLGLANASGLEVVRALRIAAKATVSPSVIHDLTKAEALLRQGATLTVAVEALNVLERAELGTLSVAETTGTLDQALTRLSVELEERSLRALRVLTMVVTALVAALLLLKLVAGVLGVLFGPVKHMYDGVGSGKIDGVDL